MGVYYELRPNHRDRDYVLVARGNNPNVVRDLRRDLGESAQPVAWGELVRPGSAWKRRLQADAHTAQRNAQRNLANVAQACEVNVATHPDMGVVLPTSHAAEPLLANTGDAIQVSTQRSPENITANAVGTQRTHSVREARYDGRPCVALYYNVVPPEDLVRARTLYVVGDPQENVYAFDLTEKSHQRGGTAAAGVPADTGRVEGAAPAEWRRATAVGAGIAFDASAQLATPPHRPVHAKEMRTALRRAGWNPTEHPARVLVRMAVKVYNPDAVGARAH